MVSSPVQNLSDFLKNRPPLVVFVICLVTLAVSTFYFAFEIEKDGPTVNSDKKHDWIQMLKHFNKLDICIEPAVTNEPIPNDQHKDEISVLTKVNIEDINVLRPYSHIYGALSLEGWYSTTCQDLKTQPKNINIFFDIPPLSKTSNDSIDVCVTVRGPAQFLPFLKEPLCKPTQNDKNSKVNKGFLTSKVPGADDTNFCLKGGITNVIFDLNVPEIENYLSDDVRTQIYIHLMWCSYFLVFVILGILVFSIVKKSEYLEKKEQSARLL